ncbi:hypothetical protein CC78DRAFT_278167 [Lojkania enalia]|uniref:Uncharacterized protein n=1 Tax=Lojkania enalia TaxID=147567 RepID=A0A9P4NA07_9PLEO|nr:hypothetical protein CC78DRAFT_278167 [Didymosphaeria enalia]
MSPPFIFRIDEIEESPDSISHVNLLGNWVPSVEQNANIRVSGGVSGKLWYCDRQRIYEVSSLPPTGCIPYKTFSAYYSGGIGIWCLRGDATTAIEWDNWHPLRFDHDSSDYSSFLTNAGTENTLFYQRPDQVWPRILLPDIYHTTRAMGYGTYGGLKGELPIFLALQALSTSKDEFLRVLPYLFVDGEWRTHNHPHPRTNQRGVVVYVWTVPTSYAGGSTSRDLEKYEQGLYGKYYT